MLPEMWPQLIVQKGILTGILIVTHKSKSKQHQKFQLEFQSKYFFGKAAGFTKVGFRQFLSAQ